MPAPATIANLRRWLCATANVVGRAPPKGVKLKYPTPKAFVLGLGKADRSRRLTADEKAIVEAAMEQYRPSASPRSRRPSRCRRCPGR